MGKFDKLFDIPEELTSDIVKITILGFNKMLVENYKAILEYQDFFIRIKMSTGLININGFELLLNEMTKDDLIITGNIESEKKENYFRNNKCSYLIKSYYCWFIFYF